MEENNLMPSLKQTTTNDNNCDKSSSDIDNSQPTSDSQLDPTVQGMTCCIDTVPLTNLTVQFDNELDTWAKFVRNRQDEVRHFMDIESPQETLKRIMTAKVEATLSSSILCFVDSLDLID